MAGRTSDWKGVRLTEVRFSRRMTHATQFFDFVLILVTVGALGICSPYCCTSPCNLCGPATDRCVIPLLPSLLHHHALSTQTR